MKIVDDTDRDPVVWEIEQNERERERNSFYFYFYFIIDNLFLHNFFNFSFFLSWIGWMDKKKKKNEEEVVFSVDRYQDQSWSMS